MAMVDRGDGQLVQTRIIYGIGDIYLRSIVFFPCTKHCLLRSPRVPQGQTETKVESTA